MRLPRVVTILLGSALWAATAQAQISLVPPAAIPQPQAQPAPEPHPKAAPKHTPKPAPKPAPKPEARSARP